MDKHYTARFAPSELRLDSFVLLKKPVFEADLHRLDTEREAWWGGATEGCVGYEHTLPTPLVKVVLTAYVRMDQIVLTLP